MAWKKKINTNTPHAETCKMTFGRKDPSCPRCQELLAGAKPAEGWGAAKAKRERDISAAIYAHDCKASNCGPVCTAFQW